MLKTIFKLTLMCTLLFFTSGCDTLGNTLGLVVGTALSAGAGYGIYKAVHH